MNFKEIIFIISVILLNPVKAQDSVVFNSTEEYKRIYSMMPYENTDSILENIRDFQKQALKKGSKTDYAKSLQLYGYTYLIMNTDHINSYYYFIKALKIFEAEKDTDAVANCKIQIGLINYTLKNSEQAIEDLTDAYNLAINVNKRRAAIAVYLISHTLIDLNKTDEAKEKLDIAERIYKELNDKKGLDECLMTNGIILLKKGENAWAILSLEKFLENRGDSRYGLALATPYLAKAYLNINDLSRAKILIESSLKVSDEINKTNFKLNALEVYRDILYAQKNYKLASEVGKEYTQLKDSLYNVNRLYKTAVMKFDYDRERKDVEEAIKLAQKEEIQKATLGRQKLLTNVFLVTSVVVLILVLGIFHQYKLKNEKNKELAIALIDLKKTQEQLIVKEKLASLGQLTAGIAHEIQNPLNFVNNFSQLSLEMAEEAEQVKDVEEAKEYIHNIKDNLTKVNFHGNRVSSIIKSMLQHSRSSTQEKIKTDINKFVEDFVNIAVTGKKAANINLIYDIKFALAPNLPPVKIVQQDIGRVLVNIFNNAFDAIIEKKKIMNGTYKPAVTVSTGTSGGNIYIDISDNGKGIPEEYKKKIFEPFFTTKATGAGTGLGLSITNELLTSQGGSLKVESIEGEGSTFRILLPLT